MPKIIKLILSNDHLGTGKENDPVRLTTELYTLDGKLVGYFDPNEGTPWGSFYPREIDPFVGYKPQSGQDNEKKS